MLLTIVLVIVVALTIFLAIAATKPNTFRVERRIVVSAPPEKIWPFIVDFHRWGVWSPWERKDPNMKRTYTGPESGVGAKYAWAGNKNIGEGHMEVLEAIPGKTAIKLDFIKPFEGHNVAEFIYEPRGGDTEVIWAMTGPVPFMGKIMHTIINMDKMIGKDFEEGLAKLKVAAES